jgi:hypothetical protein
MIYFVNCDGGGTLNMYLVTADVTSCCVRIWNKYKYEHDRPVANCKGLNLTSVPQNLSVNIVGLDLSQNNIHEIVNDSFAMYRNLVTLNLNENEIK